MTDRIVNTISGRLSLREPQRRSLEILARVCEIAPPSKDARIQDSLAAVRNEFPNVTDFERDFPSLCFALATGVGKTRLMGAFITWLHLARGINNFFVLAPSLTIYDKLIADFSPAGAKYVFRGIAEFAVNPPLIITGDNYESGIGIRKDELFETGVHINIFNISKITDKKSKQGAARNAIPRFRRLHEYLGESYFEYLRSLPDLVVLMDESHRYRASAGMASINELKPILGLELTATPFVENAKGQTPFRNVIYDYPLARAMEDGFVKEPAVVTQKNFDSTQFNAAQIEKIKLEDAVRVHEATKIELATWAKNSGLPRVKPFILVIARDTTHASSLIKFMESDQFFEGRYRGKIIQVDSSRTGAEEELMITRLLAVEKTDDSTEIVIHVNMLKEGWDVTNLYTIVPLRAANARTLVEQSIGRGLRLPYGKRTGVSTVDRLNIIAHDRFQEIIDEANRPGSVIRIQRIVLDPETKGKAPKIVVGSSVVRTSLGLSSENDGERSTNKQRVADLALKVVADYAARMGGRLASSADLSKPGVSATIAAEVAERYHPGGELDFQDAPDIPALTKEVIDTIQKKSIDIPRIIVLPKGGAQVGWSPFALDCAPLESLQPPSREVLIQHLRTRERFALSLQNPDDAEERLENYIVRSLMDFDDISYDDHADLLYDLAGQVVAAFRKRWDDQDIRNILSYHQKRVGDYVHAQMSAHRLDNAAEYEAVVSRGFTEIKECAFTVRGDDGILDFRTTIDDKKNIDQYVFTGFSRCLYDFQKFQSDTERRFAILCDRDSVRWMKPAKGQFTIWYRSAINNEQLEYVPDFVVETDAAIWMAETKAAKDVMAADVVAKKEAAVSWCRYASDHARAYGLKPWRYARVPHDAVRENMELDALLAQYAT
jgi:type III restriction enzyme